MFSYFNYSLFKSWGFISFVSIVLYIIAYNAFKYLVRKLLKRQKIFKLLLQRKTIEIQRKNETLEKNNLIQTRLISIISHDLISPLKFIHITAKTLLERNEHMPPELYQEMLTEVSNSSKELELLSTNILNWIKYQHENRRLEKEEFDLHEMVNQLFLIFQGLARQKNVNFVNEVHQEVVLYQFMEPVKIVLYNLILNAINFTERGNITITGGHTHKGILVKVKDEGLGMSEEQINNIMSEHFIVSSATVDNRKGNGLGYLIIKDMLKFVDARFVIKSIKHGGTVVSIFFPTFEVRSNQLQHGKLETAVL